MWGGGRQVIYVVLVLISRLTGVVATNTLFRPAPAGNSSSSSSRPPGRRTKLSVFHVRVGGGDPIELSYLPSGTRLVRRREWGGLLPMRVGEIVPGPGSRGTPAGQRDLNCVVTMRREIEGSISDTHIHLCAAVENSLPGAEAAAASRAHTHAHHLKGSAKYLPCGRLLWLSLGHARDDPGHHPPSLQSHSALTCRGLFHVYGAASVASSLSHLADAAQRPAGQAGRAAPFQDGSDRAPARLLLDA